MLLVASGLFADRRFLPRRVDTFDAFAVVDAFAAARMMGSFSFGCACVLPLFGCGLLRGGAGSALFGEARFDEVAGCGGAGCGGFVAVFAAARFAAGVTQPVMGGVMWPVMSQWVP